MITWIRKRLAIRSYRRILGPALKKRYGRAPSYSINQVRTTVGVLGLDAAWIDYAFVSYCGRNEFDAEHTATGETAARDQTTEERLYDYDGTGQSGPYGGSVGDD